MGLWSLILQRTSDWRKYENVTARDWVSRTMGEKAYRVIWEPLLRGKFGDSFDQISMTWLWGKFRLRVGSRKWALAREELGYPMGSFGEVFDTLAQRTEDQGGQIYLNCSVSRVLVEGKEHRYRASSAAARPGTAGKTL